MGAEKELAALVFDLGGVLIRWDPRTLYRKLLPDDQAVEHFLSEVGFYEWNLANDAGQPFAETVPALCARHPAYAELIQAYDARYEEALSAPIEPSVEILRELHAAGYPLYALSNWPAEKFYLVRPRLAFLDLFDDILVSGDVKLIKPDPRIYHLMLERIGRPAGECLLIDDTPGNIQAAAALGFQTHHFVSPAGLRADLKLLGYRIA
ncbi:MAG TPA: HAD family phosphatase [Anaerolineaceae bacterium]